MTEDRHGNDQQRAGDLRRLADLFELAGTYFLAGPSEAVDRLLADEEWVASLVGAGLLEKDPGGKAATPDEHAREFEALLRIPDRERAVPPQEAAHVPKPDEPERTPVLVCRSLYERAGYEAAPYADLPADHVGHQLRFLAALMRKEADCLERGDDAAAANVRGWVVGFAGDHTSWWETFGAKLAERAATRPLRVMAALVGRLGSVPDPA